MSGPGPRGWLCSCASHVLSAVQFDFPREGLCGWCQPGGASAAASGALSTEQRSGGQQLCAPSSTPRLTLPQLPAQSRSSVKMSVDILEKCILLLRAHIRTAFGTRAQARLALSMHLLHETGVFPLFSRPLLPHACSLRSPRGSSVPAPLDQSPCVFSWCCKYRSCI